MNPKKVFYSDNFQKHYRYYLTEPVGKNFNSEFRPELTPSQMLQLGVFGGAYYIGVKDLIPSDLPRNWFLNVQFSKTGFKDPRLNYFKLAASQSLSVWRKKGWIHPQDPHGWFQWYCGYYFGRRSDDDSRQTKRWRAIHRHIGQIKKIVRRAIYFVVPVNGRRFCIGRMIHDRFNVTFI